MSTKSLWPFLVEVNFIQRTSFRERTLFVTIEENGLMHWVDHSGRFGHAGGGGILSIGGEMVQFRGDQTLTPKQEEKEKREFTVDVQLTLEEFAPIQSVITEVGKPWFYGDWDHASNGKLHDLLNAIYWKQVNQFVFQPFDERDA